MLSWTFVSQKFECGTICIRRIDVARSNIPAICRFKRFNYFLELGGSSGVEPGVLALFYLQTIPCCNVRSLCVTVRQLFGHYCFCCGGYKERPFQLNFWRFWMYLWMTSCSTRLVISSSGGSCHFMFEKMPGDLQPVSTTKSSTRHSCRPVYMTQYTGWQYRQYQIHLTLRRYWWQRFSAERCLSFILSMSSRRVYSLEYETVL